MRYDNYNLHWSLSARRAWIEISLLKASKTGGSGVALRKESVDRNAIGKYAQYAVTGVALRKESVDRNHDDMLQYRDAERRSPQGERG